MTEEGELPEIPVVCSACETRSSVPFSNVESAVERHNEQRHDGDQIAEVDPDVLDQLLDQVGRDIGLFDEE